MANGKKGKGKKKKKTDELQLRRDIRDQLKMEKKEPKVISVDDSEKPQHMYRIGGVEGGGTHSTLIILNGLGEELVTIHGPGTNHWNIGLEETANRIYEMIVKAKEELNMHIDTPLDCVGLALSGCEEPETNKQLVEILFDQFHGTSKQYVINSDTVGSIHTAFENGGVVVIAGTGSNSILMNPNGELHTCGGWGHLMGDEGSGYWIAHSTIKYVFDDKDGLERAPNSIDYIWSAMISYFRIKELKSLLPYLYEKFDKSFIAGFTKEIVVGCKKNDLLCLHIFEEAGKGLAKHVIALLKKAKNDLIMRPGGLQVVCVGSIWKSWEFLKNGFISEIHEKSSLDDLTLLTLTKSAAIGSSWLAANEIKIHFLKDYKANVNSLYSYNRKTFMPNTDDKRVPCNFQKTKSDV